MNYANAIQTVADSLLRACKDFFSAPAASPKAEHPAYPHMTAPQLRVFRSLPLAWSNVPQPGVSSPRDMVTMYEIEGDTLFRYIVEVNGFISSCTEFEAQDIDHEERLRSLDFADMRAQLAADPTMAGLEAAFQEYSAGQ